MLRKSGLALILWLLAWLAACGGAGVPLTPAIAVDPTGGGPGTVVTITGEEFPAGVEINIRLGPPDVGASPEAYATTMTLENGSFVTSLVLPGTWPDETPIVEEELLIIALIPDGSVKATAPFDYRPPFNPAPELTLDPTNGEPGERVAVTGENFPPGTAISLRLSSPTGERVAVEVAQVAGNAQGRFRTVITIPLTWPNSEATVREQELVIAAVHAGSRQPLARATFFNVGGEGPTE